MPFLIVELAALVAVFMLVGCVIGYVIRRMNRPATEREAVIVAAALSEPGRPEAAKAVNDQPESTEQAQKTEEPAESVVAEEPAPETVETVSPEKVVVEEATEVAEPRPERRSPPKRGKADELTLIDGIGNAVAAMLHAQGIYYFEQIAKWTPEEALWIEKAIGFPGRVTREKWIPQAEKLMSADIKIQPAKADQGKKSSSGKRKAAEKPKRKRQTKTKRDG